MRQEQLMLFCDADPGLTGQRSIQRRCFFVPESFRSDGLDVRAGSGCRMAHCGEEEEGGGRERHSG